jgi:hypothetical protein
MSPDTLQLIQTLHLQPHPEGGHYVETFRSELLVRQSDGTERCASTAILYLLERGDFSALHRVRSDEIWHHYAGAPLRLDLIDDTGQHRTLILGPNWAGGERPQVVVHRGVWQAARPIAAAEDHTLCGCVVAPGFEFADFELAKRHRLQLQFPQHHDLIGQLTRA